MRLYILMLYVAGLLLTGCVSSITRDLELKKKKKKGVVFGSCYIKPDSILCDATWRNEQSNEIVVFGIKNQAQILEPGTYYLTAFTSAMDSYLRVHSASNLHNIARFSVRGGEVLYIGDLEFNISKALSIHEAINIWNDKSHVTDYLSKYKPDLLPKLQTRLIQLSPEVIAKKNREWVQ